MINDQSYFFFQTLPMSGHCSSVSSHTKSVLQHQSVQFSHSVKSNSLRPQERQHARPPCPSPTPRVHPNPCPSGQRCHPTISSSVIPFSPALNPSQHQSLLQWINSTHEVAKVLEFQLQHQSFQWIFRTDFL